MALLFFDGFDYATSNEKWTTTQNPSYTTGSLRFGTGGASLFDGGGGGRWQQYSFGANKSRIISGAAWKIASLSRSATWSFWDTSTLQACVTIESDGSIALRRSSDTGTIVAQSAAALITAGLWYWIEVDCTFNGTTGAVQVWLEGTSVINATSLNTIATANAYATAIRLGWVTSSGATVVVDDFYVLDTSGGVNNARLGDCRVHRLDPSGAGASTQWTALSGANYTNVDDGFTQDEDSTYVSTGTVNNKDLYALSDLPGGFTGSVVSVGVAVRGRKDDAGVRALCPTVHSNSTDSDGTARTLFSTYLTFWDKWDSNPDGSVAWTATTVNALQAGVKLTT